MSGFFNRREMIRLAAAGAGGAAAYEGVKQLVIGTSMSRTTDRVIDAGKLSQAHQALGRWIYRGMFIFTQDRDFLRLVASGASHTGVVYAPQGTSIGTIVSGLMLIYNVLTAEEMIDSIEYI